MPSGVYKRTEEHLRNMSESRKGKKFSEEHRKKLSKAMTGRKKKFRSEEHRRKLSEGRKGKKHSEETRKKMRKSAKKGCENHSWKGGITKLATQIRTCFKYRQWRSDILTRDNYTCQECFEEGGKLHVDHYPESFAETFHKSGIKTLDEALDYEPFWNLNNGRTLCVPCHELTETYKKRYVSSEQIS